MKAADNIIYTINWYPNNYPNIDDVVIIRADHGDEMGNWVELLEYKSVKAFIPQIYISRQANKETKLNFGSITYAKVSKVDENDGTIDLTRHRITEMEVKNAGKKFNNYKNLMNLLLYISKNCEKLKLQELVEKIIYPLHEKYENAYVAIQKSFTRHEILDELDIPVEIKKNLSDQIQKMFVQSEVKIRALFKAEIFSSRGVELLRNALVAGYDESNDDQNSNKKFVFSITIVAPPIYSINLEILDAEKGLDFAGRILERIEKKILEYNGNFAIKEKPKIMNNEKKEEGDEI